MASLVSGAEAGFEPIAGYILRERIGVGGYGEVWLADAPGGLQKAIKFVFGSIDEDRAGNELRALQRIRAVHHPFIISLERIEIINGQLIVVTELADGSLLDRFREFKDRGLVGIPRDRLLDYLRDAADALDFLCQKHDLQHLDVKPANLLMVADRIKVADFGLIKDVQRTNMSLMGGMTPTYAAPEMFDGRPGRFSDQYSLAIVYQEMLTGTLPFRGRTTAQLATEHLHKAPDLQNMPSSERPVLAKALAKKPSQRYSSCREFIDHLCRAGLASTAMSSTIANPSDSSAANTKSNKSHYTKNGQSASQDTANKSNSASNRPSESFANKTIIQGLDDSQAPSTEKRGVVSLPPLDCSGDGSGELAPSFFIGVGGTGAEVLTTLRTRLQQSGLDLQDQSDLVWSLFDTDEKSLQKATDSGTIGRLSYDEVVLLPLRPSQAYRERAQDPFHPISRRWLYNIPRSRLTEGVRPLAMLAYLDNSKICNSAVRNAINKLIKCYNDQQGDKKPIRIYLTGSVHGGTGSVFAIELAFLVRRILNETDTPAIIQCVLCAGSQEDYLRTELATSAGVACIQEIAHYYRTNGLHPGIPGLPQEHLSSPPWNDIYLVYGGSLGKSSTWHSAIEQMTDYLCIDACTGLGENLDKARNETLKCAESKLDHEWAPWLRTFASKNIDLSTKVRPQTLVQQLCLQTLQSWLSALDPAQPINITAPSSNANEPVNKSKNAAHNFDYSISDLFRENQWTAQSWVKQCTERLFPISNDGNKKDSKPNNKTSTKSGISHASPSIEELESELCNLNIQQLDRISDILGISVNESQKSARAILNEATQGLIDWLGRRWLRSISSWQSLDGLLQALKERFNQQSTSLVSVANRMASQRDELIDTLHRFQKESSKAIDVAEFENRIYSLDFQSSAHHIASQLLNRLCDHVDRLVGLWKVEKGLLYEEFRIWTHALASELKISLDADGRVRSTNLPIPAVWFGVREATNTAMEQAIYGIVQTRILKSMSIPVYTPGDDGSARNDTFTANELLKLRSAMQQSNQTTSYNVADDTSGGASAVEFANVGLAGDEEATIDRQFDEHRLTRLLELGLMVAQHAATDAGLMPANSEVPNMSDDTQASVDAQINLSESLRLEDPFLLAQGGAKRTLLLLPSGSTDEQFVEKWKRKNDPNITLVQLDGMRCAQLCVEGEQMILSQIVQRLWLPSQDRCQLAQRLHSRDDVDWLPIE